MLIQADNCVLIIIDIQTKLMPALMNPEAMIQRAYALAKSAQLLDVSVITTEHYADKIGSTVSDLDGLTGTVIHKKTFSAAREPSFLQALPKESKNLLFIGSETHVCVLQSLLETDMLTDHQCYLITDACNSRSQTNFDAALKRIEQQGIGLLSTEMVLFEWLEIGDNPHFKEIHSLLKPFN